MPIGPGQLLLHYRLVEKIGEGGMGHVWKAVDTTLDRDVAIKILPDAFAGDADRLARFEREAKTLASLNHPNIAAVYGLHEAETSTGSVRFIAMELVEGEDLSQRMARGPLATVQTLEIAQRVAVALEAAHERGVIHRDLKPANIQLTPEGEVKVLDFGLAKAADSRSQDGRDLTTSPTITSLGTVAGVILGTATYMSPEQARGKAVDSRTDIWAYGCVLYEMLGGRPPFAGDTLADLLGAIMHRDPDWNSLGTEIPAPIRRLVARCLRRDARSRLRDIGDARIVIEDSLSGEGNTEEFVAVGPPAAKRSPAPWIVIVLVTAAIAAGLGSFLTRRLARPAAGQELIKFVVEMSPDDLSAGDSFEPRLSPKGDSVAYVSQNQLWIRDLAEIDARPLPGTEGARKPFWSPDGDWVAFSRGPRLEKLPRAGGEPVLIAVTPPGRELSAGGSATWGEDGQIVYGPATAGLQRVAAQGGDVTPLLPVAAGETDHHEVGALPDGRGWIFIVHLADSGFDTIDLVTAEGERRTVIRIPGENLTDPCYSPSGHVVFHRTGAAPGIWAVPFSLDRLETTGKPFPVASGGRLPSVAQDGTLTYVRGGGVRRSILKWVSRDGRPLETIGAPLGQMRPFPDLDSAGRRLLVAGGDAESRELWMYDTVSGIRRQVTFRNERIDVGTWHVGENEVLSYETNSFTTILTSLDGDASDRVIGPGIMAMPTADGSAVVIARLKPDSWDWDIFLQQLDGDPEAARLLIGGDSVQWYPMLSPNQRFMLYTSNESGRDEVFATTFPEAKRRWQVSTEGGTWARWSADGREVYYAIGDAIMAVRVDEASGLPIEAPQRLFGRAMTNWNSRWPDGFDVARDGQRFVVAEDVYDETSETPAIVIVKNWFREFDRDAADPN
jgi:Tol biopolymer transport system component